jgi:uracil-DNA glycosylase
MQRYSTLVWLIFIHIFKGPGKMKWDEIISLEMKKDYFKNLDKTLKSESIQYTIYPEKNDIFNAFKLCDIDKLKIVIISQDPYHNPDQAHGIAFSVKSKTIPPSLRNIYKELASDINVPIPNHGCLIKWAEQGVLLLNTYLTVRANSPGSHKNIGWHEFTNNIISDHLNKIDRPIIYILWGTHAKSMINIINNKKHIIFTGSHPSPLSANQGGFFGGKYFSRANEILKESGQDPIDWAL